LYKAISPASKLNVALVSLVSLDGKEEAFSDKVLKGEDEVYAFYSDITNKSS
jgi:hypothetical protein